MKLVRRTFGLRALLLLPLVVTTVTACGAPWRDGYFKKGVHRLTQEDVSEKMGPPPYGQDTGARRRYDLDVPRAV